MHIYIYIDIYIYIYTYTYIRISHNIPRTRSPPRCPPRLSIYLSPSVSPLRAPSFFPSRHPLCYPTFRRAPCDLHYYATLQPGSISTKPQQLTPGPTCAFFTLLPMYVSSDPAVRSARANSLSRFHLGFWSALLLFSDETNTMASNPGRHARSPRPVGHGRLECLEHYV